MDARRRIGREAAAWFEEGGAMKRARSIVTLLALTALVAGACSSSPGSPGTAKGGSAGTGGKVTLNFWVFEEGGIGSFLKTLEKGFEAKYPNVDLKITTYPEDNYGVKLQTAIAARKAPDLVVVYGPEQMAKGLLLPLDEMVKQKGINLSNYVPSIVQSGDEFSCNWQGHLYCLGSYAGSVQVLYNKDMFNAAGISLPAPWPPMTPEQFVDYACRLTDKAKKVWGGAASDPLAYLPWEMFFTNGGHTATFNSPAVVHQVEVLASGYKRGCFPTSNVLDPWEQGRDYFAKRQLAMVITDFQDLDKVEKAGIKYGSTASPTPAGMQPYFFVWTDSTAVMASSKHPNEAKDFVAYLATEGQRLRFQASGDMPLDQSIAKDVNWAHGVPGREDGVQVLSHARPSTFVPDRWNAIEPYYDAWGYVIGGEKPAQKALDDANAAIQKNLDKAWKTWDSQR
jgi:multiple sugar transport system substrate-binding protein